MKSISVLFYNLEPHQEASLRDFEFWESEIFFYYNSMNYEFGDHEIGSAF